jgi:hypothetical protein
MFPTVAIVRHIQTDDDNNRFYAQAEITVAEDVEHAEIQLTDADSSVQATPLMNAKEGVHLCDISGNGKPPFKVGETIRVICFPKGEMP